jgi:sulfur relay (sulfurtransferase) complex TusBCD TusD component (DsrE family)
MTQISSVAHAESIMQRYLIHRTMVAAAMTTGITVSICSRSILERGISDFMSMWSQ